MLINRRTSIGVLLIVALIFASCSESTTNSTISESKTPTIEERANSTNSLQNSELDLGSVDDMESLNQQLVERGLNIRLSYAETVTKNDNGELEAGQTIYANDREKRLSAQWVPGDQRRLADGNNLTYVVDETFSTANLGTGNDLDSEPAIDASIDTWNNIKKNAKLNIIKRADTGENPSAFFVGGNPYLADITNLGFLEGALFDSILGPGASNSVLGVTFTFTFVDEDDNPTDINNDGHDDVALKEVWYNDDFVWTDNPNGGDEIDIETVALHENGHALGFGHFGKVSITDNNNKLHVSPRSVMNAVILGTQRDLLGTDQASYNSIYGNWPK